MSYQARARQKPRTGWKSVVESVFVGAIVVGAVALFMAACFISVWLFNDGHYLPGALTALAPVLVFCYLIGAEK